MNPSVASSILGPSSSADSSGTRKPQDISGTGTTEAHNKVGLPINSMATLLVGATSIRFTLCSERGLSSQVAVTAILLPPYGSFTWTVDPTTRFVYVEAGNGVAAYESWVWKSS